MLFIVDIERVLWWQISNSDIRNKYRAIERSFTSKLGKRVYNLAHFTSLSDNIDIQFAGESIKCVYDRNNKIDIFYNEGYSRSFWYCINVMVDLAKDDLVVEKYTYILIDLVKDTLNKIKRLLGDTNEEIQKRYNN